jgi:hypothetical protein
LWQLFVSIDVWREFWIAKDKLHGLKALGKKTAMGIAPGGTFYLP